MSHAVACRPAYYLYRDRNSTQGAVAASFMALWKFTFRVFALCRCGLFSLASNDALPGSLQLSVSSHPTHPCSDQSASCEANQDPAPRSPASTGDWPWVQWRYAHPRPVLAMTLPWVPELGGSRDERRRSFVLECMDVETVRARARGWSRPWGLGRRSVQVLRVVPTIPSRRSTRRTTAGRLL